MRNGWIAVAVLVLGGAPGGGQDLSEEQIQEIIQKFAAKETEFTRARDNYIYRQDARLHELDEFGNVRGRWEMVTDVLYSADGKRIEKVVYAPVQSLRNLIMTPEDEQDLRHTQPFVMTTSELPDYFVRYLGKQQVDEIPCYVFAVKPKKLEAGRRYFSGMVWVDDRDLQIVKTYGRGTGLQKRNTDNQFPKFETYREQIDGKHWFPTYTRADDVLHFQSGVSQRIRMVVRYEDYKQFRSDVQIRYEAPVESKVTRKP